MLRNPSAGRSCTANCWPMADMADSIRMLECKCTWHGTGLVKVSCRYPSAMTGSACDTAQAALQLSERTGRGHTCGFDCDGDPNSVRNIEVFTV